VTFADAADALSATGIRQLAEFFGLTPAEQRLTQYLAAGGRLNDAAREFGVSPHTVRNQLRAVFEKSGVQRQADLTRLVMTSAAANFLTVHRQRSNPGREMFHAVH
jgi:DNA-binding CsgD family transcriptional regulator